MAAEIIIYILSTFAAWTFALLFIRCKWSGILFDAFIGAAVHGLICFILLYEGFNRYLSGAELLWFLLMAVIVQLQMRESYGNAVLAFLLAQGAYAVLCFAGSQACRWWRWPGMICYVFCLGITAWMTYIIRNRFPSEDWRGYYTKGSSETERISIHKGHIYGTAAVTGIGVSCGMWWIKPDNILEFAAAGTGMLFLFWFGIFLLILMQAYKKRAFNEEQ